MESTDKYLLYLDFLGFSEMVDKPDRVLDLYAIVDRLNVFRHDGFKMIVFSDTLIAYNDFPLTSKHEHEYAVMFMCEFAQDLMYRLIGRGYFFRALLSRGEFRHVEMENLEAFFGQGLVSAYRAESGIPAHGLFIDGTAAPYNRIFPTLTFSSEFSYVFLTQNLDRLNGDCQGSYPTLGELLTMTGSHYHAYDEIRLLETMHEMGRDHPDPRVRAKFLAVLSLYRQRYPEMMSALEQHSFSPESLADMDWSEARERHKHDLANAYYKFRS
jgi:hypothetical protein